MNVGTTTRSSDLSFDSKSGKQVVLTLSHLPDRLVIVVSELEKIGHVIDIYFPRPYAELSNVAYHRPEFESKVIFGPDTVTILWGEMSSYVPSFSGKLRLFRQSIGGLPVQTSFG